MLKDLFVVVSVLYQVKQWVKGASMKTASIILCAGQGTRMKTDKSKMLQDVCGRPLCYWSTKSVIEVSEARPIVVVGYDAEKVKETLEGFFPKKLDFVKQEKLDGTGGAVKIAIDAIPKDCDSVLIAYGDTPLITTESLYRLINIQKRSHVPIAMFCAKAEDPTGYGRILRNNQEHISGIIEEKDASMLEKEIKEINPGVYVFDLEFLKENLSKITNDNAQKEYYLTDIIKRYIKFGPNMGPVESLDVSYEEIHGVNDQKQLSFAQKLINRRILNKHMIEGVKIIDPDNTYIDDTVKISSDVTIYPSVHLKGFTTVCEGSVIENGSIIENTVLEKNAHIFPYSVCLDAHVGANTLVGPFARIRPGAFLDENCKVGNFVEVKEAKIGKNSKVNHLAYVGDTEIGHNCNIGAGTITCNFDGEKKHKTKIEDGAFIGSNATLVAPVVVGKKSYVAAGSTITDNVPNETLAFGRARQEVKAIKKQTLEFESKV